MTQGARKRDPSIDFGYVLCLQQRGEKGGREESGDRVIGSSGDRKNQRPNPGDELAKSLFFGDEGEGCRQSRPIADIAVIAVIARDRKGKDFAADRSTDQRRVYDN